MELPMVINSCSTMTGELTLTTDTRIDGKVFAKVQSDRNVIVGTSGHVKGFMRVNNLINFGRIEGNVIVSGTTILHPGSSIFGSLCTKVFEVKEGATITARIITYNELLTAENIELMSAESVFSPEPVLIKDKSVVNKKVLVEEIIPVEEKAPVVIPIKGKIIETQATNKPVEYSGFFNITKNIIENSIEKVNDHITGITKEKENGQLVSKSNKNSENKDSQKAKITEKSGSFLTRSIQDLPKTDFSLLFQ